MDDDVPITMSGGSTVMDFDHGKIKKISSGNYRFTGKIIKLYVKDARGTEYNADTSNGIGSVVVGYTHNTPQDVDIRVKAADVILTFEEALLKKLIFSSTHKCNDCKFGKITAAKDSNGNPLQCGAYSCEQVPNQATVVVTLHK